MIDLFRETAQALSCNRLRTALTGLAVAWGIFMLIILVGMTKGVINNFEYNVKGQGTNTLNVWPGMTTEPWHGYREGRVITLHTSDGEKVKADNPDRIDGVASTTYGGGTISTSSDYTTAGFQGVYPSAKPRHGLDLAAGRFINETDMAERRKVMVLGQKLAEVLFPGREPADIIGERVDGQGLGWTVVGVIESQWNNNAYIPFTTAMMLKGNTGEIGLMVIEMKGVKTEADAEALERDVRKSLAASLEFKPDDQGAVWMWNRFKQFLQTQTGMVILNSAMWILGIFTLLSGVVGVSNIMFVSVRERTHEIGIRRAIGAKPRAVISQIILESVVITTLFGYIGIVLGIGVTELIGKALEGQDFVRNPGVDLALALEVTAVLIVSGALAGLFPALKALKVKPVEALRDE